MVEADARPLEEGAVQREGLVFATLATDVDIKPPGGVRRGVETRGTQSFLVTTGGRRENSKGEGDREGRRIWVAAGTGEGGAF